MPDIYDLIHEAEYLRTDIDTMQRSISNGSVRGIRKAIEKSREKLEDIEGLVDELEELEEGEEEAPAPAPGP